MNSDLFGSVTSGVSRVSMEDVNYLQPQEGVQASTHSWSSVPSLSGRCVQRNKGETTLTLVQHMSGNIGRICSDMFNAFPDQQ